MSLLNATPFSALPVPYVHPSGQMVVLVLVKATFELDRSGRLVPAAEPSPVRPADVLWDDDNPGGSVRYPSDVGCEKRGTDVIVVGNAVSRTRTARHDVIVRVGTREAPLVVHGDRLFVRGARGIIVGPAARFEIMPIVYERAYGGMTPDYGLAEEHNPAGVGLARREADLEGTPAPQIEHPLRPHVRAGDSFVPMGYLPIRTHWLPRRSFAGTFDAAWREARMPLLPLDYDARYENLAHPTLQIETPPPGTELAVGGMSESGVFRAELPEVRLVVTGLRDGGRIPARPAVDTILIEPARGRLELGYRAIFPMGRGRTSLREVRVDTHD